jgi:hypothetical protein
MSFESDSSADTTCRTTAESSTTMTLMMLMQNRSVPRDAVIEN